ncbi:Ig-like domain-containing protein [Micromonospora zhanjiangensis]
MAAVAALGLTGCGSAGRSDLVSTRKEPVAVEAKLPVTLAVTPATGAKKLPVSTEIGTTVANGKVTDVALAVAGGGRVGGSLREDGTSWVPASPLKYGKTYTATVTATGPTGETTKQTTTFSTMSQPSREIGSGLYMFDGATYGVAMPVVAEFTPGIPAKDRAAVQKRMFVETNPPQPGTWHWIASGTQAYYRAPEYWKPGTTLSVRIGLEGIPLSNGRYGNQDWKAKAKIGERLEMKVDNATKQMSVYANNALVKTMPVSLGKKSTPSSSGTMVVMEKKAQTVFDTRDAPDPANRYVTDVQYAQRLTWGGEFIHAAPWSVSDQGKRNVSHGCVNVSTGNAKWLFDRTKIGDPVTVSGTDVRLDPGNGWTAWNMSWAEFVRGSAIPVPAELAGAGATTAN